MLVELEKITNTLLKYMGNILETTRLCTGSNRQYTKLSTELCGF